MQENNNPNGVEVMRDLIRPKVPVQTGKPKKVEYLVKNPTSPVRKEDMPSKTTVGYAGIDTSDMTDAELEQLAWLMEQGAIENALKAPIQMPPELIGKITQEQWKELTELNYDSCENLYKIQMAETKKLSEVMKHFNAPENQKFLPYVHDRQLFVDVVKCTSEDVRYFQHALNTIRGNWTEFLDVETGKQIEGLDTHDMRHAEVITAIKEHLGLIGNQMTNLIEPNLRYLSDFFTSMKLSYYVQHPEEADEEIKKYMVGAGMLASDEPLPPETPVAE